MNEYNDRITAIETAMTELRAENALLRGLIETMMTGNRVRAQRESAEGKMIGPAYALMATRIRALEERTYTPEEAATAHEYWLRALAAIGMNADPLKLE